MVSSPRGFRPPTYPLPSSGLPLQTRTTTFVSAFGRNLSTLFLSPQAKVSVLLGNNTPQGTELRTTMECSCAGLDTNRHIFILTNIFEFDIVVYRMNFNEKYNLVHLKFV